MSNDRQFSFEAVLADELDLIAKQRAPAAGDAPPSGEPREAKPVAGAAYPYQRARAMNLAGLAFSGGGIRSAAFNLGFIQGLANHKALHLFDYLSTVSGGGYIGAWLSALFYRHGDAPLDEAGVKALQQALATPPDPAARDGSSGFPPPEARSVRFLRRYANYLTPRLGLSGDTLALIAIMLRNLLVMQLLLISLLLAGFSLLLLFAGLESSVPPVPPQALGGLLQGLYGLAHVTLDDPGRWLMAPAFALLFLALLVALVSQRQKSGEYGAGMANILVYVAALAAIAAGVLAAMAVRLAALHGNPMTGGIWVALPAVGYFLAWSGTLRQDPGNAVSAFVGMAAGATGFAVALHFGMEFLSDLLGRAPRGYAVAFAPPVAMVIYSLVISVHLALAGNAISEQQREWWARAGGLGAAFCLLWSLAHAVLLYAPPLLNKGAEWSLAGGGLWTALTWIGARLAQGNATGGDAKPGWKEIAARLAPWLFLAGLVGLVAWLYAALLKVDMAGASLREAFAIYHAGLSALSPTTLAWVALGATLLSLLQVAFVDLNLFSAHSFYRNRLARTFIGASRQRRAPNAFTGFDPEDDLDLAKLAGQRPIHLVNANLNLAGGEELAWQTRRGASFVFTPAYCGYSSRTSLGEAIGGYRRTASYAGGLSLATVVAVSGAAASPNMGFHTSKAVSALLTVCNLRLARWCPNPTRGQWDQREPLIWSAGPLFAELAGEANRDGRWINLSDGGHFENLGLYELARRRAALIVVTDVGEDGEYHFDDLAMAARKLAVDFGARLEIDPKALDALRAPAGAFSHCVCAVGRVVYPDCASGSLIYVKSALTRDVPVDIRQYRDAHPTFPHESTADQWFDEDQFEAYRHLGQCVADKVARNWLGELPDAVAATRIAAIERKVREALA